MSQTRLSRPIPIISDAKLFVGRIRTWTLTLFDVRGGILFFVF